MVGLISKINTWNMPKKNNRIDDTDSECKGDLSSRIKDRESWLKVIVIVMAGLVLALFFSILLYKLALASFKINITDFKFSDLLTLLLAFFSIGMSIAFFFKASETSNSFYDNTYRFTKDISEVLGRIEERFGEKLSHIDSASASFYNKFDSFYSGSAAKVAPVPTEAEDLLKKTNEDEKKATEELNGLVKILLNEAKLKDNEKKELQEKLDQTSARLRRLIIEKTEQNAAVQKEKEGVGLADRIPPYIVEYTLNSVIGELDARTLRYGNEQAIKRNFSIIRGKLPRGYLEELNGLGLLDDAHSLTERGVLFLRKLAR